MICKKLKLIKSLVFILCLILSITLSLLTPSTAFAADDTLKKLFFFQQKMAESGVTSAMMKMGVMYEHGEGVKQSTLNALIMYKKAYRAGHVKAIKEIQRIKKTESKSKQNLALKKQQRQKIAAQKKRDKDKTAYNNALKEKAKREKLKKENYIKAQKLAKAKKKEQAARIANEKRDAQATASIKRAKQVNFAKLQSARKAREIEITKNKAAREAELANLKTEQQVQQGEQDHGFKTDPCKSKAARLLSTCR